MKFIYSTTTGYRGRFFLLLLSVLFGTVSGAMFPYITGKIVDEIFYKQQMRGFLLYFFLYAGLYFLNQCGHGVLNYLWAHLEASYVVDIRKRCFKHLLQLKAAVWRAEAAFIDCKSEILNLLLQEKGAGKTFVMVTHRETSVARCSRVIEWEEVLGG